MINDHNNRFAIDTITRANRLNVYTCHAKEAINAGHSAEPYQRRKKSILFLAHPSHWYLSAWDRLLKLRELILGRATYGTERVFKRVAN